MSRALSPMYLSTMAEETTFRKFASMLEAIALANSVFPVPGGPYSSTPCLPNRALNYGMFAQDHAVQSTYFEPATGQHVTADRALAGIRLDSAQGYAAGSPSAR